MRHTARHLFRQFPALLLCLLFGLGLSLVSTACQSRKDPEDSTPPTSTHEPEDSTQTPGTASPTGDETDTGTPTGDETTPDTTPETETERETFPAYAGVDNAKTVNTAALLANGVTGYYASASRGEYIIENQNVLLRYVLSLPDHPATVGLLANREGTPYLRDTMDTFLTMDNGLTYYASGTAGRVNLYDQGFYYYDVHVLSQTFTNAGNIKSSADIDLSKYKNLSGVSAPKRGSDGVYTFTVKDAKDPYICYVGLDHAAADFDAVLITLKSSRSTQAEIFYIAGSSAGFNADQRMPFSVFSDGAFHSYLVPISKGADYTGRLTGLRLDIGSANGEKIEIKEFKLVKFSDNSPQIQLDRNFIAYSDKLNDVVRFMADETLTGISAMGTETKIPSDTVQKLIIRDGSGLHDTLDGVDWDSAVYVGFDIRDAGILGYILLPHETSGHLSLTLEDGVYILRQSYRPAGGTMKKDSELFVGHRIYTDMSHDFAAFLHEADCERNPLTGIRVAQADKQTYYAGYDPLRGAYEFMIRNAGSFSYLYSHPEEQNNITFEIDGDKTDRRIYILAHTKDGCLECAAVMDENMQMLPIRVEVCKNFAHDGEELYYTYGDSISYGYALFPMVVEARNTEKLTVAHLYERWGQYRLKQISSIRFHQAYYHMSTGVTETNCIAFYNIGNRLPDHRAMSQTYWRDVFFDRLDAQGRPTGATAMYSDQPQHENNGSHTFLRYVSDGVQYGTQSVRHHIDSSGPTYFDITMDYISDDGRMTASIRHMEMPQYDENRAYYQLEYEVTDTIPIKNFTKDFEIYAMTTNRSQQYTKLGYLDSDNQPQIVPSNGSLKPKVYRLGSEYPYFDYFLLEDPNPSVYDRCDMYSNLSVLIRGYDIVIGGQAYTGPLVVTEKEHRAVLTLDLDGVTLQPGDHIRIDMILMPWGDGKASQDDSNVRLTRENTLLHPITASSDRDIVMDDVWMPKVRSADGQTAVFTVSGGLDNIGLIGPASDGHTAYKTYYDRDYNVTVRVYGFRQFGKPVISELINGEWVVCDLASEWGYDGYAVLYDEDNSFSYSFVINISQAKGRTFRITIE